MKNNKIILGVVLLMVLFLTAFKMTPGSYRSGWETIQPGETLAISHPLNKEPDSLIVWTKLNQGTKDVETVRPWTELSGVILINDVDNGFVTVQNIDNTAWQISIFVR